MEMFLSIVFVTLVLMKEELVLCYCELGATPTEDSLNYLICCDHVVVLFKSHCVLYYFSFCCCYSNMPETC